MSRDESAQSRFQRLDALFQTLKTVPAAEQRAGIDRAAQTDPALAAQLEQLLRHHRALAPDAEDPLLRASAALRSELRDGDRHGAEPGLPQAIGRFQIRGELAQGGFGRVLRAEDPTLGREVAIKILRDDRPADPSLRNRLLDEGRVCGRLQHPAIVPVYEIGTTPTGEPYLAMKVVEGRDLATLLRERATPSAERARFVATFEQVCQAIAYAHGRGIVHRDLKPQNIMIGAFGEVQVMDWGLAVEIATEQGAATVPVSGTPAYMAPEQARGEQVGGGVPADVFGLGAILCEILTGEPPYGQGSLTQTLARARAGDLSTARALLADCGTDRELAELAQQCLGAEPAQRPMRAADVAAAVRAHLDSAAERVRRAELAASVAQARELSERRARRATAALAAVVVAVAIAGLATWYAIESVQRARTDSEEQRLTDALVEVERRATAARVSTARDFAAWDNALATAEGMRALITASVRPQLAEQARSLWAQVEQRTTDLRFLAALDADLHDTTTENRWDRRSVAQSIRTAMAARLGAPIESLAVDGVATALAKIEPRDDLVNALDAWARIELEIDRNSAIGAQVHRVANAMDEDPWRRDLRAATAAGDLEQLRTLADAPAAASAQPSSLRLLALALVRKGDHGTGIRVLRRSAQRYPSYADTLTDLAWLLLDQALYDAEEVKGYARTILALNPNSGSAYHMLAYLAAQKSDLNTALELAERAVQCGPNDTGFRATLASLRLRCGDIATGLADLRWCLERSDPNHAVHPDLLQQLGAALTLAGRPEEAVDAYCKAIGHHRYRQDRAGYFPDPQLVPQLIEVARTRLSGGSWQVELLLANMLDFLDDAPAALAAYERVTRASPAVMVRIQERILELRATLGQPSADLGAAGRTIDAVSAGADYAAARARLATAVAALRETGQLQLAEYSEGLLCEQYGLGAQALPALPSRVGRRSQHPGSLATPARLPRDARRTGGRRCRAPRAAGRWLARPHRDATAATTAPRAAHRRRGHRPGLDGTCPRRSAAAARRRRAAHLGRRTRRPRPTPRPRAGAWREHPGRVRARTRVARGRRRLHRSHALRRRRATSDLRLGVRRSPCRPAPTAPRRCSSTSPRTSTSTWSPIAGTRRTTSSTRPTAIAWPSTVATGRARASPRSKGSRSMVAWPGSDSATTVTPRQSPSSAPSNPFASRSRPVATWRCGCSPVPPTATPGCHSRWSTPAAAPSPSGST
jgi:tetratricopeptide (TPR) repeat protein